MCTKLGITLIGAASPQAKGRVERGHGTHQDRLIKKLRLEGICDVVAANAYVETSYLPAHDTRFAIAPTSAVDHHRVRDRRRLADADVFCLETIRVIGNDHVVQYQNRGLQLDRALRGRVPAKNKVVVRELIDGTLRVVSIASDGRERVLPGRDGTARPTAGRADRAAGDPSDVGRATARIVRSRRRSSVAATTPSLEKNKPSHAGHNARHPPRDRLPRAMTRYRPSTRTTLHHRGHFY